MRTFFPLATVALVLLALPGAMVFAADLLGYEPEINGWLEHSFQVSHRVAVGLPAAVALFCVPPLIILLYFLRLRRKPVAVSSTYLWKKSIEDLHVNRLLQWLRKNVLLLLQLLAILMLIYAALGPRLHGRISGGKHYILLLDNSASMSATDLAPDRLTWAKAAAIAEIDGASDGDTGMVIVFNSTAEILQSYTNNRDELRAAVRSVKPTQKPTRIDEALSLAASLANPQRSTENAAATPAGVEPGKERTYVPTEGLQADVHLYSDGRFPPTDFALANLNLTPHTPPVPIADGIHSNNIGVTKVDSERGWLKPAADDIIDPADSVPRITDRDAEDLTKMTVLANIRNHRAESAGPLKIRLDVYEDGDRLIKSYTRTVKLEPQEKQSKLGRTVSFYLTDVPEGIDRTLKVSIDGANDAFSLDDVGWLTTGTIRKAKVLVVTPDNNFLLRAFFDIPSSKAVADVAYIEPAALADAKQYLAPAREGAFDLVLFDRCGPPSEDQMPAANTLFIGYPPPPYKQPSAAAADAKTVTAVKFPTVQGWDDKHPAMANLRGLYDIGIDEAFRLPSPLPDGTKRLMEGDRGLVLLAALQRGPFSDLVLTFPLLASDGRWNTRWVLEPSFVLFLRNVLTSLGNVRDAAADEAVVPGREKILRPGAAKTLTIRRPDGSVKSYDRGSRPDFAYTETTEVGVYTAEWTGQTRRFAVNLFPEADHDEGDLAPVDKVTIGAQTIAAGDVRKSPQELWKIAVLLGLFALMLEWWVYNRRVRV